MGMLARYKKNPGQIIELVKLIEESAEPKRSNLLRMIRAEDPEFSAKVEAKVVSWEVLKSMEPDVVAEIVAATPAKHLALALHGESNENFKKNAEKGIGTKMSVYREETSIFEENPPNPAQVDAGRRKMISEARKLDESGAIKLPQAVVQTGSSSAGQPLAPTVASSAAATTPADATGATAGMVNPGNATIEGGCPPVESFAMEAPPPGLSGERLETWIKNNLK